MANGLRQWSRTIRARISVANASVIAALALVAVIATLQFQGVATTVDAMSTESEALLRLTHSLDNGAELIAAVDRLAEGDGDGHAATRVGVLLEDTTGHAVLAREAIAGGAAGRELDSAIAALRAARTSLRDLAAADDPEVATMLFEEQVGDATTALGKAKLAAAATVEDRLATIGRDVREPVVTFWWVAGVAAALALAVLVYVRRRVLAPIETLRGGVKRIEAGHGATIALIGDDELTELATAFNGMARAIAEREASLQVALHQVQLVLDNTEDGMFVTALDGAIERGAVSATAVRWFGPPGAAPVWTYLYESEEAGATLRLGLDQLAEDILPVELLLDQMPRRVVRDDRSYDLTFVPIDLERGPRRMLVVVHDVTEQLARQLVELRTAEVQRALAAMLRSRTDFARFAAETDALIVRASTAASPTDRARALHTLKGNSAIYGLTSVAAVCHELEQRAADSGEMMPPADAGVLGAAWRELRGRIDAVLPIDGGDVLELPTAEHAWLLDRLVEARVDRRTLARIRSWSDTPGERLLAPLVAGARQLAERLDRDVEIIASAGDVRIDAERTAPLWTALSHAVRNAIDHGIESRPRRAASGKPARARLELTLGRTGAAWSFTIADDGAGLDWPALLARAEQIDWTRRDHAGLIEMLFRGGVSTRDTASETSGRGIGLSALRAAADQLSATVELTSQPGCGTRLVVTVPDGARSQPIPSLVAG